MTKQPTDQVDQKDFGFLESTLFDPQSLNFNVLKSLIDPHFSFFFKLIRVSGQIDIQIDLAMAFVLPHLLILILLLLPFSAISQTNDGNISVGSTLTAGANSAFWRLSPSDDFAFGFRKLDNDQFLLAIWYHKIAQKTIVWYANGDNPAPRQSRVELTNNGLILRQPQGDQELWRAEFPTATAIAYGLMNDTGNFMLVDTSSRTVWESFKQPTDTLLPTQVMKKVFVDLMF